MSDLKSLQEKGELFIDMISRLTCSRKIVPGKFLKADGKYWLEISGEKKELKTEEPLKHILRITEEDFIQLKEMQVHPDETLNTILFRLAAAAMQAPAIIPENIHVITPAVKTPEPSLVDLTAITPDTTLGENLGEVQTGKYEKICPHCNERFLTDNPSQIYCCTKHQANDASRKYRAKKKAEKENQQEKINDNVG
jgi:hypothetical protein